MRCIYILSSFFHFILYHILGYRKSVVRENLQNAFPNKDKKELREIEKKFYLHLSDLFLETIKYRNISSKELSKRCTIKNLELIKSYEQQKKSFICLQAHYGNWEWTTYINQITKHRVLSVYKPLHDSIMDKFMINTRKHFGAKPVSKNNILRVLARREKAGKLSAVGLVSDQVPDVNTQTYWRTFLNQDTPVFTGAEKLAKTFDMPVVFLYSRKVKRGYYEMEFVNITETPKQLPSFEITDRYIDIIENIIKKEPEYWIWSHKRWKRKRPQEKK